MTDYIALRVDATPSSADITDLIAAFLAEVGYDSFSPDQTGVTAYISAPLFDPDAAKEALAEFPFECALTLSSERIESQDWNSEWEKNYFKPILIGHDCLIHSSFHRDLPEAKYDIVIDPRMAFGTGHHATTASIVRFLLEMPIEGKHVIDMGTGTGILAILCAMRGAGRVDAIEIDPGACENAAENAALNEISINLICGDASALADLQPADIFLANINRNIILADLSRYVEKLRPGGSMLLSGFYTRDIPMIERSASRLGLKLVATRTAPTDSTSSSTEGEEWVALRLTKS